MIAVPLPRVAFLALCLACTHTRTAADARNEERAAQKAEDEPAPDDASKQGDSKSGQSGDSATPQKNTDDDGSGEGSRASESTARDATGASAASSGREKKDEAEKDGKVDPEDIQVATSPQGLLEPGALDKVRDKLGVGKGESVQVALRRFQREQDLPATGMLDHETVERLGLSPDDIFESKAGER